MLSNRRFILWFLFISSLFLLLNYELIADGSRMLKDNFYYAFPFFNYIFQSFSQTSDFPLWNMFTNHGEPTFLFLNNNYLLHLPYIPFYVLSKFISHIDPIKIFWSAIIFANYIQALLISLLVYLLAKSKIIFFYAFVISLFSGVAIGQMHQMQINASSLYLIILFIFLILWAQSGNKVYWYLSSFFLGTSLLNHYPHLVVYLLITIIISLYFFNNSLLIRFFKDFKKLGTFHILFSLILFIIVSSPIFILYFSYVDLYVSPFRGRDLFSNYSYLINTADTNSFNFHSILHYIFPKVFFKTHLGQIGLNNLIWYMGIIPLFFSIYFLLNKSKNYSFLKMVVFVVFFLGLGAHSFGYFILYKFFPFAEMQRLPAHFASYLAPILIIASAIGLRDFFNSKPKTNLSFINTKFYLILFVLLGFFAFSIIYLLRIYDLQVVRYFLDDLVILIISTITFIWLFFNRRHKYATLTLFIILFLDIGSFAHRNLTMNVHSQIEGDYQNLPRGSDYFKWNELSDHHQNFGGHKVYQSLIFGRIFFDLNEPLLLNKNYKNFLEKHSLVITEGATSKSFALKKKLFWIPENIIGEENIVKYMLKNESRLSFQEIRYFPNELSFNFISSENGRLVWVNNFDDGWTLTINNRNAKINKLGSFIIVDVAKGRNDMLFSFNPYWGHLIRFIFYLYLIIPSWTLFIFIRRKVIASYYK